MAVGVPVAYEPAYRHALARVLVLLLDSRLGLLLTGSAFLVAVLAIPAMRSLVLTACRGACTAH